MNKKGKVVIGVSAAGVAVACSLGFGLGFGLKKDKSPVQDVPTDEPMFTASEVDAIKDAESEFFDALYGKTDFKPEEITSFSSNEEGQSWSLMAQGTPKNSQTSTTVIYEGSAKSMGYIEKVNEVISSCNTTISETKVVSADDVVSLYENLKTLVKKSSGVSASTLPDEKELYEKASVKKGSRAILDLVYNFTKDNGDYVSSVADFMKNQEGMVAPTIFVDRTTKTAVVKQTGVFTETVEGTEKELAKTFLVELNFAPIVEGDDFNLTTNEMTQLTKKFIENGGNGKIAVEDKEFEGTSINIDGTEVFAKIKIADMEYTSTDNINLSQVVLEAISYGIETSKTTEEAQSL